VTSFVSNIQLAKGAAGTPSGCFFCWGIYVDPEHRFVRVEKNVPDRTKKVNVTKKAGKAI
jgi:hypothetical protein